jgi:type II secretory pathway pseudopilin PulG
MMANVGQQLGSLGLQQGQQFGNLGNMAQQLGLSGANAVYNVGQQQQQQGQQELNTAYQQFMNQAQWPYQGLNIRESALSNSPYNITNQTTLPNANQTAQNLGMFASLAGLAGGGGSSLAPYGGQPYNSAMARS